MTANETEPGEAKGIVTTPVNIPSAALELIRGFGSLRDIIIIREGRERGEALFTRLVTILNSPQGLNIIQFILKVQATTQLEIEHATLTTRATVSRNIKNLTACGVLKTVGRVGPPYRVKSQPGPPVPIYVLEGAPAETTIEAQRRYGEIIKVSKAGADTRQTDLEEAVNLEKVHGLAEKVFNHLPRPLGSLGPVYPAMRDVGVPPELQGTVRDLVIEKIQGAQV